LEIKEAIRVKDAEAAAYISEIEVRLFVISSVFI